jgi:glycosyltransferase involved in cell wall biosynthesis
LSLERESKGHFERAVTKASPSTAPLGAAGVDAPIGGPRTDRVDVTVVLPVHNEVGHVADEVERIREALERSRYSYEIIAIDDASTDGTLEVLKRFPELRVIEFKINRGCGYARRVGTREARGDVVVWTDADMTYPNHLIPELVAELESPYQQVVGARRTEEGTHAWARRPMKWFVRSLASYLTATHIPDLNSGFRAFRRETAKPYLHMLPDGFSCVTTITLAFLSNGHLVRYWDIDYAQRAGRSKFHWIRDTYLYVLQVLRIIMTFNPLRVFLPLGGALLLLAFGKILFDVFDKSFRITTNAVILTIVAVQVVAIGLLADLVCRLAGPRDGDPLP